jgi:cytochrome c oxidase assembly factor CtaG
VEHLSFLSAGLIFWWPVIPSWPSVSHPQWSTVLYLFLATLPCDALSAFLAFCDRVVYPAYLNAPRPFDISPLADQQFAGALMWVCVTFAYLVPAVAITTRLLSRPDLSEQTFSRPIPTKLPSGD